MTNFDLWTDENLANMEKWWAEGLSATTIAAQLGHGCTRSAVLGKIHRKRVANGHIPVSRALVGTVRLPKPKNEAIPFREPPVPKVAKPKPQQPSLPSIRKPPNSYVPRRVSGIEPVAVTLENGERVTILHLSDKTCRWPIGDVGSPDFHFCGNRPETVPPYCDFHTRMSSNGFPTRSHRSATVDRRWGNNA